jgi:predicted anti-sigma-YlaC factor YlaD
LLRAFDGAKPTAPADPFNQMMDLHPHIAPEELAAYVDGRAESSEWDRMTSHLATCQACLREMLAVVRLLRNEPGSRDGGV